MNRTLKCIAKNKINSYRSTQLLLSLPITGWKLQDKNSNIYPIPTHRVFILNSESRVIDIIHQNKLFVKLLDIGGQRAFNASPSSLLNGKGSKQRVRWSKKFEKKYKEIFKKKDSIKNGI